MILIHNHTAAAGNFKFWLLLQTLHITFQMLMNAKKPVQHVNKIVQTHLEVISVLVTATDLHSIKIDFVQVSR